MTVQSSKYDFYEVSFANFGQDDIGAAQETGTFSAAAEDTSNVKNTKFTLAAGEGLKVAVG